MAILRRKLVHSNVLLSLLIVSLKSPAQIPNSGFEDWATVGNRTSPVGWFSTNDFCDTTDSHFPITKSTDHYPNSMGSYSIRIANNVADTGLAALGGVMTTHLDTTDRPLFPITGHPDTLYGYFKFFPQNNDTMDIHIFLYYHSNEVASGTLLNAATVSEWTLFKIPISTHTGSRYTDADSARISLFSFYGNSPSSRPSGNSVLYVDSLSLSPPSTNSIIFSRSARAASFNLTMIGNKVNYELQRQTLLSVKVYNTEGRLMLQPIKNEAQNAGFHSISLSFKLLTAGSYVLDFIMDDASLQERISIVR